MRTWTSNVSFTLLTSRCSVRVPACAKATAWHAEAQRAEVAGSVLGSGFGVRATYFRRSHTMFKQRRRQFL